MTHWRPNVYRFTRNFLESGLQPRAITRDMHWGVPVPFAGLRGQADLRLDRGGHRLPLGQRRVGGAHAATPDAWERWWKDDAVPPVLLHRQGQHPLPHRHLAGHPDGPRRHDPAVRRARQRVHELRRPEGLQERWHRHHRPRPAEGVRPGPDPLLPDAQRAREQRHRLLVRRADPAQQRRAGGDLGQPGPSDADVHPALLRGKVPGDGSTDPALAAEIERTFETVTAQLDAGRFKETIGEVMALARVGNRFFDEQAPWRQVKEDRAAAVRRSARC